MSLQESSFSLLLNFYIRETVQETALDFKRAGLSPSFAPLCFCMFLRSHLASQGFSHKCNP